MRQACNLLVLLQVVLGETINAIVEFDPLHLIMLHLPLKRLTLSRLSDFEALFGICELPLQIFKRLLLLRELVLNLRGIALLLLLQCRQLFLQILNFEVLLAVGFKDLRVDLFLDGVDPARSSLLLLTNPRLQLCLFHLVEVLHLAELGSLSLSDLLALLLELFFALLHLSFEDLSRLDQVSL